MVIMENYGKQKNIFTWNKVNVYEWFELFIFFLFAVSFREVLYKDYLVIISLF